VKSTAFSKKVFKILRFGDDLNIGNYMSAMKQINKEYAKATSAAKCSFTAKK
jgi:hypothetical protein